MIRINNITLGFEEEKNLRNEIAKKLKTNENFDFYIVKKAIDARKRKDIKFVYSVDVDIKNQNKYLKIKDVSIVSSFKFEIEKGDFEKSPIVIGSGPAGLFCALNLALAGAKPIVVEQGGKALIRRDKIEKFFSEGHLDVYNNIQFGEGGAGTFSDGKLTTNIKDERIKFVLETFVENGAPEEILYKAKPHIGTNYLVEVVQNMRRQIEKLGGEFLFDTKFVDFETLDTEETKVSLKDLNEDRVYELVTKDLVLAIGHSSRDTFYKLHENGVQMEPKPFSVGFRIEHLQKFINQTQYNEEIADNESKLNILGAAEYKINTHLENGKGVYSFCMCPGGFVVNASSEENTVLTNGMSNFERNEVNANSAILLSVGKEDYEKLTGDTSPLSGITFQRYFEKLAFELGGSNYYAPVQLVSDFLESKVTETLGEVKPTIRPGYKLVNFNEHLPEEIAKDLKEGLTLLDKKIKGFSENDAIITGFETRSSSPVRFYRDENYKTNIKNLYVCGEGCGFAGGITSSAVDGLKCAEKILGNSWKFQRCIVL